MYLAAPDKQIRRCFEKEKSLSLLLSYRIYKLRGYVATRKVYVL